MINWFAKNSVAANLLMIIVLGAGFLSAKNRIPLEVFPSFELDIVTIAVPYRGSTPAESEEGVVLRVEEAIYDLDGIKHINSTAAEGAAVIQVEVETGYDARELLAEIKNRVDAISTFPAETERPTYEIAQRRREVIAVAIAGDLPELQLRQLGEQVRDEINALPGITQVELEGIRDYEISIEIPAQSLEAYDLSLNQVSAAIAQSSLDLSAGQVRTPAGDILLRTRGQAYEYADFAKIIVVSRADGTLLTLGDIADIRDGFDETPLSNLFNGKPSVLLEVYRTGNQSAIEVADAVKTYVSEISARLPEGVEISTWRDRSRIVKARLATLTSSAIQGGILIFCLLTLFLRLSVAIWVCVGIPVSFTGAMIFMPELGLTFNIVSLFAFILVLGIVVDDAIVTGESIYSRMKTERSPLDAAIKGTHDVAVPVTFGVLTTAVAFLPILFMGGHRGAIFAQIPMVVISVLLFSLVESKLVLPSHMTHIKTRSSNHKPNAFQRFQRAFADKFESLIERYYQPLLEKCLKYRYATWSLFVGGFILTMAIIASGDVRFVFMPRVPSETARASLEMPAGTPYEVTQRHIRTITDAALELQAEQIDPETGDSIILNILSTAGSAGSRNRGANSGRVMFEILSPEKRSLKITSNELVQLWRQKIGDIPGAQEVNYRAEIGRGGNPVEVRLTGSNIPRLEAAAQVFRQRIEQYPGVFDVGDSLSDGKRELQLSLKPEAEMLGITVEQLARQTRAAFFGIEAQRIQRGRDDVRVLVRYPDSERRNLATLEQMKVRTSDGTLVPFNVVANVTEGRSYNSIRRMDRERVLNVFADADKTTTDIEGIKRDLRAFIPDVLDQYPGVKAALAGEAEEQAESTGSLGLGLIIVLFVIYVLLAIPLKSYGQPLMVMSVIPFGLIGAVLGHIIMGMDLSILSFMGMLALTGVVVNDSLVLVDYVNQQRQRGMSLYDAVASAGVRRFRAVLLTSITTFSGVTPLLLDKTTQAQFLIPMGISLGFGVLFATAITLLLVPSLYLIVEDIKGLFGEQKPQTTPSESITTSA